MTKARREGVPGKLLRRLARLSALSFILVVMTFLGLYAGMYLDKLTHMAPNFTFLGLVLGIALGFRGFVQEVLVERRKES
ncbi:MAG TPA: AtpZ/AtpI family protein [Deltaproteobacteria bacterium]|nr:AtpZ/AtpI family protein [Deltaproteobacteria bacterium]HOM29160.1 AtpZ/AtpI family protein [Deltaproteobacteria bacterium]HPP80076.1 AtpZ/AtpI family protein [Deltaproteobacteria bacterium]